MENCDWRELPGPQKWSDFLSSLDPRGQSAPELRNDLAADGDLTDMLGELRVLLPTAQLLSAFLITVPFAAGFSPIARSEKHVFLATFILAIVSLVLLSAPAVQHRLIRPLNDRGVFKVFATRLIITGSATLGLALVLATQLVISAVFDHRSGNFTAAFVAVVILTLWWVLPKAWRRWGHV